MQQPLLSKEVSVKQMALKRQNPRISDLILVSFRVVSLVSAFRRHLSGTENLQIPKFSRSTFSYTRRHHPRPTWPRACASRYTGAHEASYTCDLYTS